MRSMAGGRMTMVVCALAGAMSPLQAAEWRFDVAFQASARAEPFTGRVYLFFGKPNGNDPRQEPRFGPDWFQPQPFVAMDVTNWKPGEPLTFSSENPKGMLSFPKAPGELDLANRRAQAVARFNPLERNIGTGAGNGYSESVAVATADGPQKLTIDRLVPERAFEEGEWVKLLEAPSERLSRFHGREAPVRAAILLPASYVKEPQRRYPVIFSIPGFGGTHFVPKNTAPVEEKNPGGVEFLRVFLDPSCPLGHHVFADSENNGPWGTALVKDFLPELDRRYRTIPEPTARFVTGHSSGGWSSLWLQVTWPDTFGGVWSTAPDPVDFHDFQRIDLYRPGENMYRDGKGEERPIARINGKPVLWYRGFDHMETVLGPGGQLHSFEAVFSPRGNDGRPLRVWSRETGAIDAEAAKTWEKYDIRLVLERNWPTLGPKLAGKIHVDMGEDDTFYLEGATRRLKETLKRLGSDAVVEMHPGKDHGSLLTRELVTGIRKQMAEQFLRHHPPPRPPDRSSELQR